jgi:hypothetical protein
METNEIYFKNNSFILKILSQKNININATDLVDIPPNASIALEKKFIQQALIKNQISIKEVINISEMGLKALDYPTIKRCLANRMNIFFSKIRLEEILRVKTKEELSNLLKKYQKNLKRNPLFIFFVPSETHDQLHELKQDLLTEKKY